MSWHHSGWALCIGAWSFTMGCTSPMEDISISAEGIVAGAGFTTFDATRLGCTHGSAVNCNAYDAADAVYINGGPSASGLADGVYFFAVLVPGHQNGGFLDGAVGNLSDAVAGGTAGDLGSGSPVSNRTFTVAGRRIVGYGGTHAVGTSPSGRRIIGLAPFDPTSNPGGVHVVALCREGATEPSACAFDAFRITGGGGGPPVPELPVISGMKYYDANANGVRDPGEPGIAGWPIDLQDGVSVTLHTDASGLFEVEVLEDDYSLAERQAARPWIQTGNVTSQTVSTGGATARLLTDGTYRLELPPGSRVDGLYFGNLCLGAGNGRTLGFWSNKNGQALVQADDLAMLRALSLRGASGAHFDPASYASLRSWLLSATATNMAYMLSAQLAAAALNVHDGLVGAGALVYAPGAAGASPTGFITMSALIAEADAALAADGLTVAGSAHRAHQEVLKNALDDANNNRTFVQPGPTSCPAPAF